MATIIRPADAFHAPHAAALNLDDLAAQARQHLAEAEAEAERMVAQARAQADDLRRQAAEQGRETAVQAVAQTVAEQLAPVLSALQQAVGDLRQAKQAWQAHWESSAVHLAAAIAAKITRRELRRQPDIPLALIREALELAAGSPDIRLRLHPADYETLGEQVQTLIDGLSAVGKAEVTADPTISRGGCIVDTRFGSIDQQFETQLRRIEEELTG